MDIFKSLIPRNDRKSKRARQKEIRSNAYEIASPEYIIQYVKYRPKQIQILVQWGNQLKWERILTKKGNIYQ